MNTPVLWPWSIFKVFGKSKVWKDGSTVTIFQLAIEAVCCRRRWHHDHNVFRNKTSRYGAAFSKNISTTRSTSHTSASGVTRLWSSLGVQATRKRQHVYTIFSVYSYWNGQNYSHISLCNLCRTNCSYNHNNWLFCWNIWASVVTPCAKLCGTESVFVFSKLK